MVLNLWVKVPLGVEEPFRGIRYPTYQILTLLFITVAKLHLHSNSENNFKMGITRT